MSAAAATTAAPETAPAPVAKRGRKLMMIVVCLVFTAVGAVFPMLVDVPALFAKSKNDKAKEKAEAKTAIIPFGDVTVNLSEERMSRYLRVKISIAVDADSEEKLLEELPKQKAAIKSKIIGHLSGKTVKDVSGKVGHKRAQRELLEIFEDVLYPEGNSKIKEVHCEEFIVQ